jgi:hypothetical protein
MTAESPLARVREELDDIRAGQVSDRHGWVIHV